MAGIEKVVRPFESRELSSPATVALAAVAVSKAVVIEIGKGGGANTIACSYSLAVTRYMVKVSKETASFGQTPRP